MMEDESNYSDEQMIKKELFSESSITKPKETTAKTEKTKTELIDDKINELLGNGTIELKDRNSKLELQKLVLDQLNLSKGWSSDVSKAIKKIAEEKKLKISKLGFKPDSVGGVKVNLISNDDKEPETQVKSNVPTTQSPYSALPKTESTGSPHSALPKGMGESKSETLEEPEKKYMSEDAQARLIKKGLNDIVAPLYISLGIVEPDEEEKKDEAELPTAKKFRKDMDDLGDDINKYLKENNIQLPALLNHLAILLSVFMVLVVPVIKFKFFTSKQEPDPKFDASADEIEVKA